MLQLEFVPNRDVLTRHTHVNVSFAIELNNKPKRDGTHALLLRITATRKHARINLGYSIPKKDFNRNARYDKHVRKSHLQYRIINNHFQEVIHNAKLAKRDLLIERKTITANAIKKKLLAPTSVSFLKYADEYMSKLENANTRKGVSSVLKRLKEFQGKEDLLFTDITRDFIRKYQQYLKKIGNNQGSSNKNVGWIRTIYTEAIKDGRVDQASNPFFSFKLPSSKPENDYLDENEIRLLESLKLPKNGFITKVRDAFLFAFYNAGMRVSDWLTLQDKNIVNDEIHYRMFKTGTKVEIPLKHKPQIILNKYRKRDTSSDEYIFPFLDGSKVILSKEEMQKAISSKSARINRCLKDLAKMAGIKKRVATHTARRSFLEIAKKKHANTYDIKEAAGHSSIKTTEGYFKNDIDKEAIQRTLDSVFPD